ncbi:MAG: hypothetical protein ACFWUD_08195 [Thermocaproicibacter melissae]|jgi:hypothetical protein|uniref:hypothetical protein n=1 Tax=Thermocaproicibacter melissae TaxID=2966552 RepID=UPI0024B0D651|nr:hypothetical protein [Thermocaproicibacter melissae]WBY64598.1 hypothetical protein NOG13_02565 [Thermocaproicibacter melissae]
MLDTGFHNISIELQEHWARITTDEALMDFLAQPGNGSVELANYILQRYQEAFQKPLAISEMSLAVEILIHAYVDLISKSAGEIQKALPKHVSKAILNFAEKLHERTAVIDCGEKSVDNNRFVFDGLAPFHPIIFSVLRKLD